MTQRAHDGVSTALRSRSAPPSDGRLDGPLIEYRHRSANLDRLRVQRALLAEPALWS